MQTLGFRRPNQVREAVYRHLKDLLLSGRFSPGERLSEPLLAQELGVSRTPVREALMRLAEEGLVELVPGKGARVRVFAPEEVEEVYGVRALLEGEAAREAARALPASRTACACPCVFVVRAPLKTSNFLTSLQLQNAKSAHRADLRSL